MNKIMKTALSAAFSVLATGAMAGALQELSVNTHRSQGDVMTVPDATARLLKTDAGIFVSLDTGSLEPAHIYTLWLAVVNAPGNCEQVPCSVKDVLKRTDIVQADVGYADGAFADADGRLHMSRYQAVGALDHGWFERGLTDVSAAEVHLIVQNHGPVIAGREAEMLSSYRGGCTDESIPAPMPESARTMGNVGPYACAMVQDVIFVGATVQN